MKKTVISTVNVKSYLSSFVNQCVFRALVYYIMTIEYKVQSQLVQDLKEMTNDFVNKNLADNDEFDELLVFIHVVIFKIRSLRITDHSAKKIFQFVKSLANNVINLILIEFT
jgi:hypothetical protein